MYFTTGAVINDNKNFVLPVVKKILKIVIFCVWGGGAISRGGINRQMLRNHCHW